MSFGFVSRKKYLALKKELEKTKKELIDKREEELCSTLCLLDAQNECKKLTAELFEYKKKYADEVQKRIALVEQIKEAEGEG